MIDKKFGDAVKVNGAMACNEPQGRDTSIGRELLLLFSHKLIATMKPVVTRQAPMTLERKITPLRRKKNETTENSSVVYVYTHNESTCIFNKHVRVYCCSVEAEKRRITTTIAAAADDQPLKSYQTKSNKSLHVVDIIPVDY